MSQIPNTDFSAMMNEAALKYEAERAPVRMEFSRKVEAAIAELSLTDLEASQVLLSMSIRFGQSALGGNGTVCINPRPCS